MLTLSQLENDKTMWELWLSRYHLATVAAADQLGIFANIQKGIKTVDVLAKTLGFDVKGIEAICCLLASLGLLKKRYYRVKLTRTSKNYLLVESSSYWGPALSRVCDSQEYERILNTFLKVRAARLSENGNELSAMWSQGKIDKEAAEHFTSIMDCTIYSSALQAVQFEVFAGTKHLLDVGGGSGCYASLFVKKYPEAKATIFELPQVCEVSRQYLEKYKALDKVSCPAGNFFTDPFPNNCDAVLFSNILHDWSPEQGLVLLKKAFDVLPKGGKAYIHEMILNQEKNGPLVPASFNLLMYINHGSQQFTESELFELLTQAGFREFSRTHLHSYYSIVIAKK